MGGSWIGIALMYRSWKLYRERNSNVDSQSQPLCALILNSGECAKSSHRPYKTIGFGTVVKQPLLPHNLGVCRLFPRRYERQHYANSAAAHALAITSKTPGTTCMGETSAATGNGKHNLRNCVGRQRRKDRKYRVDDSECVSAKPPSVAATTTPRSPIQTFSAAETESTIAISAAKITAVFRLNADLP